MKTIQNKKFRDFSVKSINNMKKYLIYSQLLYWNLQSIVDKSHRIIKKVCQKKEPTFSFQKLKNIVAETRKDIDLEADVDIDYDPQRWFILKILTPSTQFSFEGDPDEKFNPEIDHIFPLNPDSSIKLPKNYNRDNVDTIWSLQPVKGEINNYKRRKLPQDFFDKHPQYLKDYSFLPTTIIKNEIWAVNNFKKFLQKRKKKILAFIKNNYGINIKE